jgi:hypothetical protein
MSQAQRRLIHRWLWVLSATVSTLACLCVLPAVAVPEIIVQPLDIGTGERLLVITPHPDDETLSAAA